MKFESLKIAGTQKSPEIMLDPGSGVFHIKGMSQQEYAREFYLPVIQWIDGYAKHPAEETTINFRFKYFNTSSAKSILFMLQRLNEIRQTGKRVIVNWYYDKDDEQMIQDGENYSDLLGLPFNLIEMT